MPRGIANPPATDGRAIPMSANGQSPAPLDPARLAVSVIADRDVPPAHAGRGSWRALFEQLLLRLEKTPRTQWLCLEVPTDRERNACASALRRYAALLGVQDQVEIVSRKSDARRMVLIRRSERWGKANLKGLYPDSNSPKGSQPS